MSRAERIVDVVLGGFLVGQVAGAALGLAFDVRPHPVNYLLVCVFVAGLWLQHYSIPALRVLLRPRWAIVIEVRDLAFGDGEEGRPASPWRVLNAAPVRRRKAAFTRAQRSADAWRRTPIVDQEGRVWVGERVTDRPGAYRRLVRIEGREAGS